MEDLQRQTKLIDALRLSDMLCVSKRQIFRLNSQGKLPKPIHLGGSVRWSQSECQAWIMAGAPDRKTWEIMKGGR